MRDRSLSLKSKGLLSVVLSLPNDWDYSISGLCYITGEGETIIKSALKELKDNKYLVVTKLFPNESSSGRIEYVYDFFESPQDAEKQGVENLPLENQSVETVQQINTNIYNTKEKNTDTQIYSTPYNPPVGDVGLKTSEKSKPSISRRKKNTESYDLEGFTAFWAAYPKKIGKAAAIKAWNKLKPDVDLQERMGNALEVQKNSLQWRKDNGKYIPMASTWLNGKRWEDELTQEQNQTDQFDRMMEWAVEYDTNHGNV